MYLKNYNGDGKKCKLLPLHKKKTIPVMKILFYMMKFPLNQTEIDTERIV